MLIHSSRSKRLAIASATLAVLAIPAACSSGGSSGGSAGTTLTIAAASSNASLDPVSAIQGWPLSMYTEAAYEPLIERTSDGSYAPALATTFGYVGDDNSTYEITLREGVKFSDGAPLDSDGLKAWIDYSAKSPGAGQGVFKNMKHVDVDSPTKVTIHLSEPDPNLAYNLSQEQFGFPISPAALKKPASLQSGTFGAGPYMLDKRDTVLGTKFTYVKNPNYWNKKRQHWDEVVITVVPNQNAALSAVQSGQALITNVSPQLAAKAGGNVDVTSVPTYFAGLEILDRGGVVVPALKDSRVRRALNFAVDRKAITKSLFGTFGKPSVQGLVDTLESYSPDLDDEFAYDPKMAKQLLAEAGYPNGFTLPIAVLPLGGQESAMAQAVAGYFNDIGIKTDITPYADLSSGFADVAAKKIAVIPETTFFSQDIDLIVRAQLLAGLSVINPFTETPEKDLVDLYDAATRATGDDRTPALRKLQSHVVKEGLYVHTTVADTIYITSKKLDSLKVSDVVPIVNFANIKPAE